jgi:hypothetical protein
VVGIHGDGIVDPTATDTALTGRIALLGLVGSASLLVLILIMTLLRRGGPVRVLPHDMVLGYSVFSYDFLERIVGKAIVELAFIGCASIKDQYHRKNQWCDNKLFPG